MNRCGYRQLALQAEAGPSGLSATPVGGDDLRITGVRPMSVQPNRAVPKWKAVPGSWSAGGVAVASPVSTHPKFYVTPRLSCADGPRARSLRTEVETDKGVKGYGPGGGSRDWVHFDRATPNSPSAELLLPAPGGPDLVYDRYEEDNNLTRGPEGIFARPSDGPGFGWDLEPAG